jgi:voltage-gated potassium channel
MFFCIGVLAIFSGSLASILVDKKIRKELGMDSYTFENHIILCE